MNHNGQCAMEIDDFSSVNGQQWCDLWPQVTQIKIENAVDLAKQGQSCRLEEFCPTAKGTAKWWDISVTPIKDASQNVTHILSVSRDITRIIKSHSRSTKFSNELVDLNNKLSTELVSQRHDAKAQTLKSQETDHRIKNSLAQVISLLRMQSRSLDDSVAQLELEKAASRVMSIGKVHEQLYMADVDGVINIEEYLRKLGTDIEYSLGQNDIEFSWDVAPIKMSVKSACAVGMIVSELITNAIKYAFDSGGQISVTLKETDEEDCRLTVSDNGIGLPCEFSELSTKGLGSKIIRAYSQAIGADMVCKSSPEIGTTFEFTFSAALDEA